MRVVFVHGACVRDGAWWWQRTAALLAARGISSAAPRLPSCGEGDGPGVPDAGLDDDVAAVRAVLASGGEPAAVVAHSYGGIVVAEAAAGLDVAHLLLVSSYLPQVGESLGSFGGPEPAPFLDVDAEAGVFGVRPEAFAETFMQDCLDAAAEGADRLVRQSASVVAQPVRAAAWQQLATTYLVCGADRGTPPAAQREFARRAGAVVELDAGHHPFISQPQAVADLVVGLT